LRDLTKVLYPGKKIDINGIHPDHFKEKQDVGNDAVCPFFYINDKIEVG